VEKHWKENDHVTFGRRSHQNDSPRWKRLIREFTRTSVQTSYNLVERTFSLSVPTVQGLKNVANNLYVGNMAFSTTEATLRELFSQYGTVTKAQLVMDRETGKPRGFAFIEMSNGGDQAIAALNGSQLDGRSLTVNEAKPREERPRSGGGGGGYGGGRRY
jgi:cold-inducible RNA-binding protein